MNILVVTQYFHPENFRINDLVFELKSRGHSVIVLTGLPNYPDGKLYKGYRFRPYFEEVGGVKIVRSPLIPRGSNSKLMLALNYLSFPLFASFMSLYFLFKKVDKVFVYGASPVFLVIPSIPVKIMKNVPIVLWIQDLWPESLTASKMINNRIAIGIVGKITSFIYHFMDKILITSPGFIESLKKYDKSKTPIEYLPQWGEELFEKKILSNQINVYDYLPKESFNIVFAGNIGFAQNLEILIKAASLLKEYKLTFVIVGDGRDKGRLQEIVKNKGLTNIIFPGSFKLECMPNFFDAADVLFLSLINDPVLSLTVPGKIQAYMAMGKPIITAINGAASDVIRDAQVGLTCSPDDPKSLAESILKIFNMSQDEKNQLKENARIYYQKNYSRNESINRVERILQSI